MTSTLDILELRGRGVKQENEPAKAGVMDWWSNGVMILAAKRRRRHKGEGRKMKPEARDSSLIFLPHIFLPKLRLNPPCCLLLRFLSLFAAISS
jgi:hypothetical protein